MCLICLRYVCANYASGDFFISPSSLFLYPGLNEYTFKVKRRIKHTWSENPGFKENKRLRFGTDLVSFVLQTELKGI